MDYGQIIKKAFDITLKHKSLWLFGFLAALTSGGGNFTNFPSFSGTPRTVPTLPRRSFLLFNRYPFFTKISSYSAIPNRIETTTILLVGLLFLLVVAVILVFVFIHTLSQAAMIGMVDEIDKTDKTSIKEGFHLGWRKWFLILAISLLLGIPTTIVFLLATFVLITPAILSFIANNAVLGIVLLIPAIFVIIALAVVLFIPLAIITFYAFRFAVISTCGVIDSIKKGFFLFKDKLGTSLLLWLINLGIGIVFGMVTSVALVILALILVPIFIALYLISEWLLIIIVPVALVAILAYIFLLGLLQAYISTYWTVAWKELVV